MRRRLALLAGLVALGPDAGAHDGVEHRGTAEAAAHRAAGASGSAAPLPVTIEARFDLIDQTGRRVSEADFAGRHMAIFFGYANCPSICSVALPRLGRALDLLGPEAAQVTPLMITVDPARDTVATMGPALAAIHPRLIGLTGTGPALAAARAAFQVEARQVAEDPEGGPIYAHGSFIYLVGPEGRVLTLLPPILGPERMAGIIAGYL